MISAIPVPASYSVGPARGNAGPDGTNTTQVKLARLGRYQRVSSRPTAPSAVAIETVNSATSWRTRGIGQIVGQPDVAPSAGPVALMRIKAGGVSKKPAVNRNRCPVPRGHRLCSQSYTTYFV